MKKTCILLSLLLLAGCAFQGGEIDDLAYEEETGLMIETTEAEPEQPAPTYVMPQPNHVQPPTASSGSTAAGEVVVSADGTVIELPAQKIYIGNGMSQPVEAQQAGKAPMAGLSYSQPMSVPNRVRTYTPQPVVITLQNRAYPNTYVQCMSTDPGCVASYEGQGYIRVQGLPQFAGYQDVLAPSDYPQEGRWRNNNNIPRW